MYWAKADCSDGGNQLILCVFWCYNLLFGSLGMAGVSLKEDQWPSRLSLSPHANSAEVDMNRICCCVAQPAHLKSSSLYIQLLHY